MPEELLKITSVQKDILKEVSNIGAGSGATALATLLRRKIKMSVPGVNVLPLEEVANVAGGADRKVAGIYLRVEGAAPCNILFIFSTESAAMLIDILLNSTTAAGTDIEELNLSVMEELGNIVAGSFLNSLSTFTGLKFYPSVPSISIDMAGALLNSVMYQYGFIGEHALVIETEFAEQEQKISGDFFLIPDPGSLTKILSALGVEDNGEYCQGGHGGPESNEVPS